MKHNNLTVSIFIPAHNEQQNIGNLLSSILRQDTNGFELSTVAILCDGCTDDTTRIAREFTEKSSKIKITDDGKRLGKHRRLIDAFAQCQSEIAVVIDGDLLLSNPSTLSELIMPFKDSFVSLVGGNNIPIKGEGIENYLINIWTDFWLDVKMLIRTGNNIHNVRSCCLALRASLLREIKWPEQLQSHGQFLYLECLKKKKTFRFQKNAIFWYRNPDTFSDYAIQKKRGVGSSKIFSKHYGQSTIAASQISLNEKAYSLIVVFLHNPIKTIVAIACKLYIGFYLKDKPDFSEHHFWKVAASTKKGISMDHFSCGVSYPIVSKQ